MNVFDNDNETTSLFIPWDQLERSESDVDGVTLTLPAHVIDYLQQMLEER